MARPRVLDMSTAKARLLFNTAVRQVDSLPFMEQGGTAYRAWTFDKSNRPQFIPSDVVGMVAEWNKSKNHVPDDITLYTDYQQFEASLANIQVVADLDVS